jgi:hypothetical protein
MSDARRRKTAPRTRDADAGSAISVSERCELLASTRRRHLIRYLRDRPGEAVTLSELTRHLGTVEEPSVTTNVRLSLEHVHLPKLSQAGVAEYRPRRNELEYRSDERLEALLAFVEEDD